MSRTGESDEPLTNAEDDGQPPRGPGKIFHSRAHSFVIGAIIWLICRPARWHALAQITLGGLRSVTGLEWFAFVILPVAIVALGGLATWFGLRLIP
jgi:hypothetical protein